MGAGVVVVMVLVVTAIVLVSVSSGMESAVSSEPTDEDDLEVGVKVGRARTLTVWVAKKE